MTGTPPNFKADKATWRARAREWCVQRPMTAWFLAGLLFLNYLIDLAQSLI